MKPYYYVVEAGRGNRLPATIRKATKSDYDKTVYDHWQTSWFSDYIQQSELEKYALEITETQELWLGGIPRPAGGRFGVCGVY